MSTDAFHRPGQSGMEPPASLTSVRVKRRQALVAPSGKRGDLTDDGDAVAAQEQEAPPAPEAPKLTQAAIDADHQARVAQTAAAAPPAERADDALQPVIVLPPPVLNGEDRDALLPMAETPPRATATTRDQGRPSTEAAPEPVARSRKSELLLTSRLPSQDAPKIQAEVIQQPQATYQPAHEPEAIVQAEVIATPAALYEPEMPEIIEPEIIPHSEVVPELKIVGEPEADKRREPVLTIPPAEEPELTMPAADASQTVIPLPVAAPEPKAAAPEANAPDLLDYWDGLRGVRDYPVVDELDRSHIAGSWPNTVLVGFKTELPQITRIGENNGDIEYTAMVTSWLMSRGRHAVKRGEAMEEEQKFPTSAGSARYRLLLLPMMGRGSEVCDHVLCQVTRSQERSTGFSFKRWLAS